MGTKHILKTDTCRAHSAALADTAVRHLVTTGRMVQRDVVKKEQPRPGDGRGVEPAAPLPPGTRAPELPLACPLGPDGGADLQLQGLKRGKERRGVPNGNVGSTLPGASFTNSIKSDFL